MRIIVLNNGSSDDTSVRLTAIKGDWPELIVIDSPTNLGCSKGREVLWRETVTDYVLSIDEDILLTRQDLEVMLEEIEAEQAVGLISPLIQDSVTSKVLNPVQGDAADAEFFYEGCFLLSMGLIRQVGYFDSELKYAGEGLDYSIRLRRAGYRIVRASAVCVTHVDRVRESCDWSQRRVQWAYSFAYLYWKNYGPPVALWFSLKNLCAHFRKSLFRYGVLYCFKLSSSWLSGVRAGIKRRYLLARGEDVSSETKGDLC